MLMTKALKMLPVIINHIHVCRFSLQAVNHWIIMTGVELATVPLGLNGKESLLNCKLQKFSLHTHKHCLQFFLIPELL